jgi:phosphatidylethanolamine/phosphatidyl-N-methylethanolamine N-methyltransferase
VTRPVACGTPAMDSEGRRIDRVATEQTKARYSRIAPLYDWLEAPMERMFHSRFRRRLFAHVQPCEILEIGVGTGRNLEYYPDGSRVTAVDLSPPMLDRARSRACSRRVTLLEMDAQALAFPDDTFDLVLATFVFCSVPDPILGLTEARRVLKPGGKLLLLEHVRPEGRLIGDLFDALNPLVRRLLGPEINRPTVLNVLAAGWRLQKVDNLFSDIVKLLVAVR